MAGEAEWTPLNGSAFALASDECARLCQADQRVTLSQTIAGAYTGEALLRRCGGQWILHQGHPAVRLTSGVIGFPHGTVQRILGGEPYKSLASMARTVPAIEQHGRDEPG